MKNKSIIIVNGEMAILCITIIAKTIVNKILTKMCTFYTLTKKNSVVYFFMVHALRYRGINV